MKVPPFESADLASLPAALDAMVRDELADGEKLAWVGRPRAGRMILASVPMAIFGVFFGGFAVFWIAGASRVGGAFGLFGLPFVAVGLALVASPIWAGWKASRTCYAVTNRRAVILEPGGWDGLRVRSYRPEDLGAMARNQRGDGSGDLVFEEITTYRNRGGRHVIRRGFLAIDRVRDVETLIRSALLRE